MLNVIRSTRTNENKHKKKTKTKIKKNIQKADYKLTKIKKRRKKKKRHALKYWYLFRGREDIYFCKCYTTEPVVSLPTRVHKHW